MPYLYETHCHTYPVSKCAHSSVREMLSFYKSEGYTGLFLTNHFLDGNINIDLSLPYEKQIEFYFSDYEEAKRLGAEIGIQVLLGIEMSYRGGTDFLVYGLDKDWFLAHPEVMQLKKSQQLPLLMEAGALVIHAHPFREASYIDHIRLFPRCVHGVETFNANRTDFENELAEQYAQNYGLLPFAGTDCHSVGKPTVISGLSFDTPLLSEQDFIDRIKRGEGKRIRHRIRG